VLAVSTARILRESEMRTRELILYGKPDCPLCEKARAVVVSCGFVVSEVNIEEDEELFELYRHEIPVLALDGKEILKGIVTRERLLEKLRRVEAGP
jgi:glutaredoxin